MNDLLEFARRWARTFVTAFSLVSFSFAPVATESQAQASPDVVELRNGGLVRGTIVENIPGSHVTIQLITGEVRRFPMAEVLRVGRGEERSGDPVTAAVVVVPRPTEPTVRLRVVATAPETALHRLTGMTTMSVFTGRGFGAAFVDQFEMVCVAPCERDIPAGSYTFGVSQGNGMARRADHSIFHLDQDTTLELDYENRDVHRALGWVVLALASAGYLVGITVPLVTEGTRYVGEILAIGSIAYVVASIPAFVLLALNDHADIRQIAHGFTEGIRF